MQWLFTLRECARISRYEITTYEATHPSNYAKKMDNRIILENLINIYTQDL